MTWKVKSHVSSTLSLYLLIAIFALLFIPTQSKPVERSPTLQPFITCLNYHCNASNTPLDKILHVAETDPSETYAILRIYIRNNRFNLPTTPKPLAIVTPLEETHVPPLVLCAKDSGLALRIRSGGHDYEGLSYVSDEPFIILDLFNLRSIEIDLKTETAWAQAGATTGELYYNIVNKSNVHGFPAGVCSTVGLGGHFGGGGYGDLLRKYGLSIDNIIDARMVDVKGRILDRKAMGEDLFWAIRGGGPASFGVVLAWRINLVRVPEVVTVFSVPRTLEQGATGILYDWQLIAPVIDKNLFIRAQPIPKNKTVQVDFNGFYLGTAKTLLPLVSKEFPSLGLEQEHLIEKTWIETTLFNLPDIKSLLNRSTVNQTYAKFKSDYVTVPIPKSGLQEIWKKLIEVKQDIIIQFSPYGGRMSEIPYNATAFPHRAGNLYKIQYITTWVEDGEEAAKRHFNGINLIYNVFTPYVSKNPRRAFLNYRDLDIGTNGDNGLGYALDYFGRNLERLQVVKTKVDPDDFFRYEQSIPVLRDR